MQQVLVKYSVLMLLTTLNEIAGLLINNNYVILLNYLYSNYSIDYYRVIGSQ